MPKSPKGKKRKVRSKKEKTKKHPKRLKFADDDENIEEKSALTSSESEEEDDDDKERDEETNLEKMLEENAKKNNLTAINVKSILHHVVKDKRVRDLVQKAIAEEEAKEKTFEETSPLDDLDFDFEPKMTRSKFKQRHQDDPIAQLTRSPIKRQKPVSIFTDLEFPESSSDEEYDPEADEEDEDTESCQSDLASPFKPASPDSQKSDTTQESDSGVASTSGSRPFTRHRSQETIFKKPDTVSTVLTPEKEDLIAKRTRSLLPIKENLKFDSADFMLPDYMPDLYDTVKLDDLDKEDIDFQLFLQGLINGEDEDNATEDEDKEYDYMAEDHKEEKEEYRNDRAVRIPKQEVSDLFEELFNFNEYDQNGSLLDESPLWGARGLLPMLDDEETVGKDVVLFSEQQRTQLSTQMNQHVQLLSQVFILSREDPTLQDEKEICRQYINELQGFSERASSAHYMMALNSGYPCTSMFEVAGLSESIRIVNEPFNAVKRPRSPRKQAMSNNTTAKIKPRGPTLPAVSSTNQAIMATSSLFHREELLPRYGFPSKDPNTTKDLASLRIKFTETEDNLLALGMKQFQKNWKLIQTHLLPVKTPKQLHIRCKNLLSNRAQMNVVKYLRQNNSVWELPTKIRPISSPDVSKRFASSDTPDWLVSYQQKLKNSRKQSTSNKVKSVKPSQTDTLSPSGPSSNKISASRDVPNSGKEVTKTTTTGGLSAPPSPSTSPSTMLALPNEKENNDTKKTNLDEREQSVENLAVQDRTCSNTDGKASEGVAHENNASSTSTLNSDPVTMSQKNKKVKMDEKVVEEESEIRNQDMPQTDEQMETETQSPEEPGPQTSPGKPTTGNPLAQDEEQMEDNYDDGAVIPEPLGSVENDENIQFTSTLTDDQEKTLVPNDTDPPSQGTSEITNDKAAKSPPVTTATKTKGARDKSTITSTSNPVSNANKKISTGPCPIPLDPDPKEQVRSQALADSYMAKVKKTLKNDQERYEEFLGTLVTSSANQWTPVQLYHRVEVVLSEYPQLVEDFIAFLEPEEALEAGVLMENLEFVRARTFLRRLEVHFHKTPSHFKKIIKAFSSWNAGDKTPNELHEKIIPLLRGQQHLIDEFQSFFDNLKPPVCSEEDFEEVEIGSGSDPEVDDFEEVVIPDVVDPKKHKGKTQAKIRQTSTTTRASYTGNRQKITQKPNTTPTTTKTKQDQTKPPRRRNRPVDRSSKKSTASRDDVSAPSEGEEETSGKKIQGLEGVGSIDKNFKNLSPQQKSTERPMEYDESPYDQNPSSVRTEWSASDGPLSVASSLNNETSNDSLKYEDRDDNSRSNKLLIHQRTISTDDVIDDFSNDVNDSENDDVRHDEYSYSMAHGRPKASENFLSDAVDDFSTDVTENENDDNEDSDNYDELTYEGTEDEKGEGTDLMEQGVISARNHLLGQDGRLIVLWTREDDRTILSVCHNQGATVETFEHLSRRLTGKSAPEIKTRFEELIKLFQADSKDPSSSEEEDEVDEDSEGSEPETDS